MIYLFVLFQRPSDVLVVQPHRFSEVHPVSSKRLKQKAQEPIIINSLQDGWRASGVGSCSQHPGVLPISHHPVTSQQHLDLLATQIRPQPKPTNVSPLADSPGIGSFPGTCSNDPEIPGAGVPPPPPPPSHPAPSSLSPVMADDTNAEPHSGCSNREQSREGSVCTSSGQSTSDLLAEFESYVREYSGQEGAQNAEVGVLGCGYIRNELEMFTSGLVHTSDKGQAKPAGLVNGSLNTEEVGTASPVEKSRRKRKRDQAELSQQDGEEELTTPVVSSQASLHHFVQGHQHNQMKTHLACPPSVRPQMSVSMPCSPSCKVTEANRSASVPARILPDAQVLSPDSLQPSPAITECTVTTSTCNISSGPVLVQKKRSKPGKDKMMDLSTSHDKKEVLTSLDNSHLHPPVEIYEVN